MTQVVLDISMSVDGFIARPSDEAGPIHSWFFSGTTDADTGGTTSSTSYGFFATAGANTQVLAELLERTGAIVTGRRTYDFTDGWAGNHPFGHAPVFVVTHSAPREVPAGRTEFTFVPQVEDAIRRARGAAGGKDVVVMGGASIARQCVLAGLLDEVQIHLAPVLLGRGIRLISDLDDREVQLEQTRVIQAPGVTHLRYRVSE